MGKHAADSVARRNFVLRVYTIFVVQLALTALTPFVLRTYHDTWEIDQDDIKAAMIISAVCFGMLFCCKRCRSNSCASMMLLMLFTVCVTIQGATQAFKLNPSRLARLFGPSVVISVLVVVWMSATIIDFTGKKFLIFTFIVNILVEVFARKFLRNAFALRAYGMYTFVVYTLFVAIITQMLMAAKQSVFNPKEPVVGALLLYTGFFSIYRYSALLFVFLFEDDLLVSQKKPFSTTGKPPTNCNTQSGTQQSSAAIALQLI